MRRCFVLVAALALIGCGDDTGPGDAGGGMDAGRRDAGAAAADAGGSDATSPEDGGGGADTSVADASGSDAGSSDAGSSDAGPPCTRESFGTCSDPDLECLSCPAGGPSSFFTCTTTCRADRDCAAPLHCNRPTLGTDPMGICTERGFTCFWGAICASPDTLISTPTGERPIEQLSAGDLVYTMHEGQRVARPILGTTRTPVLDHAVVRAVLSTGRVLEISGGHPTADGRTFTDLVAGETLDGVPVVRVEMIPYEHAFTYDILPDSDSGTYVAGGVLIGSTLAR